MIRPFIAGLLCSALLTIPPTGIAHAQEASWAERIKLSGDFRVRQEGFFNQKTGAGAKVPNRNRIRVRGRLGLAATVNSFTSFNLRMATGNPQDPISTNETLDEFFQTPHVNMDRAFIRLTYSRGTKTVSTDLGKIPNPAYSASQVVWDSDLNPTGITEKFSVKGQGALKQFDVQLMQYTIKEVKAGKDAGMVGGQVKLSLAPTKSVGLTLGIGDYKYIQANQIALSTNAGIVGGVVNPGPRKDVSGKFVSKFNLVNVTGELTIQTGSAAYPLTAFWDWVINTGAKVDATGKKENTGLYTGIKIGKAGKPGEVALAGTFVRIRQDAVLSTFSFSDIPPDGRQGGMIEMSILLLPKTLLAFTGIFTKPINGAVKSTLVRTQLDLSVQF